MSTPTRKSGLVPTPLYHFSMKAIIRNIHLTKLKISIEEISGQRLTTSPYIWN